MVLRDYKRKGRAAVFQTAERGVRLSNPAPFLRQRIYTAKARYLGEVGRIGDWPIGLV